MELFCKNLWVFLSASVLVCVCVCVCVNRDKNCGILRIFVGSINSLHWVVILDRWKSSGRASFSPPCDSHYWSPRLACANTWDSKLLTLQGQVALWWCEWIWCKQQKRRRCRREAGFTGSPDQITCLRRWGTTRTMTTSQGRSHHKSIKRSQPGWVSNCCVFPGDARQKN